MKRKVPLCKQWLGRKLRVNNTKAYNIKKDTSYSLEKFPHLCDLQRTTGEMTWIFICWQKHIIFHNLIRSSFYRSFFIPFIRSSFHRSILLSIHTQFIPSLIVNSTVRSVPFNQSVIEVTIFLDSVFNKSQTLGILLTQNKNLYIDETRSSLGCYISFPENIT